MCGDGFIRGAEQCDPGNTTDVVNVVPGCTDCLVDANWQCENEPSTCDGICGDGVVIGSEECDWGTWPDQTPSEDTKCGCVNCVEQAGFDCSAGTSCRAVCGDGIIVGE